MPKSPLIQIKDLLLLLVNLQQTGKENHPVVNKRILWTNSVMLSALE